MCGREAQENLAKSQTNFYNQATYESSIAFNEQQTMLKQFQSIYDPILAKGPNQEGYSAGQVENLNSQTVEGTAENYAGAAKALNENLAAQGGGNIPLTTGEQTQLKAELAAASAGEQSKEETQVQEQNYAAGRDQFNNAGAMMAGLSNEINPTAYESAATSAGQAASTTLNEIGPQVPLWASAAMGAAGSVASGIF